MKVLALNCGSSSVKYQLYSWEEKSVIAKGVAERIGFENSLLTHECTDIRIIDEYLANHTEVLELLLNILTGEKDSIISDISDISVVVHRVVHGGQKFARSTLIDDDVIRVVKELSFLAPLHNPPNLEGIAAIKKIMPQTPQVAVFDTAFHQSLPEYAYQYAIPREWYEKYQIRRYGFHGTSHLYVSKRAAAMLGKPASECNLITMHIGNGVSHTAIRNGLSVDTSMGMTPLEGAIMGTRSGDIDPSIPFFIEDMTGVPIDDIYCDLNNKSGILGITGKYVDRRDIAENAESDPLCRLALDMESYKIKQYIGKYIATLGRVDAVVFTAGVGENSGIIRQLALEGLEDLGIKVDKEKNLATNAKCGETVISAADSKIKVLVIPTNEEQVLIEDAVGVINGTYTDHMSYPYTFL